MVNPEPPEGPVAMGSMVPPVVTGSMAKMVQLVRWARPGLRVRWGLLVPRDPRVLSALLDRLACPGSRVFRVRWARQVRTVVMAAMVKMQSRFLGSSSSSETRKQATRFVFWQTLSFEKGTEMKAFLVVLFLVFSSFAFAANIEADAPAGATQCGFYLDTATTPTLVTVTAGKCRLNVSAVTVGTHSVTADARVPDPIWGTAISPKASPAFTFTKPGPVGSPPTNFVLVP